MGFLSNVSWSPYVVGAGIGVLSWLTFLLSDKAIGCSTAFARTSGMLRKLFGGGRAVKENAYYSKVAPVIDWEWMLVLGILLGSALSALLSGDFHLRVVPPLWAAEFGPSPLLRIAAAFAGGIFTGFGARWAGGCTSGHGISGTMQLTLSSWIAAICFFIGGIAAAWLLYGAPGQGGV